MKTFYEKLRELIDPKTTFFNRSRRIRSHNFFRFRSYREFKEWYKHFDKKQYIRKINWDKIDKDSTLIILNNFNRYQVFTEFFAWLETLEGKKSYLILDNNSTYKPLLNYYQQLEKLSCVQVLRLGYNSGIKGIADIAYALKNIQYFIVSDVDLLPYPNTPKDFIAKMRQKLDQYPHINHVGASLEIEDIPEYFILYNQVKKWESQHWLPQAQKIDDEAYIANIDTTFAMYRNASRILEYGPALRLDRPYTLKHYDWYINPDNISEELWYYINHCLPNISSWTGLLKKLAAEKGKTNNNIEYEFMHTLKP
jgi:hypothetical protein